LNPLDELRQQYPWPQEKPSVPEQLEKGWFCEENQVFLRSAICRKDPCVILELGSWMGMPTRFLCDISRSDAIVIAIDHWEGSDEHRANPEWAKELPTLYSTFLVNCWKYQKKLVPMKESTLPGMKKLSSMGIKPSVIYLDAAHDMESVSNDLATCLKNFPDAIVIGDDWSWDSVREGVMATLKVFREFDLKTFHTCYEVSKC